MSEMSESPRGASAGTPGGRPLRVLLTTDWWEPVVNGVVASVTTLRRELLALGCDVRVLTLSPELRAHREADVYRIGSLPAQAIYSHARIGMPTNPRALREILRWRPDVVHSHCEFSTHITARRIARHLGVPLVHTHHTNYEDYTHYYSPSRAVGRKVVETLTRRLLDGTDAVIAPTQKMARVLRGYGVHRPLHVIPTGLDLRRFRPAEGPREEADAAALRAALGIAPGQRVLISLSRLAQEKNLRQVLEDVAAADRADTVLVMVGEGPQRAELEEHARHLGIAERVRFPGGIEPSQVPRWYRIGDAFVSASQSESQGLTFIEAMACGLPLLCRRDPSLDPVVIPGRTGWQLDGPDDLARHLEALWADEPRRRAMARTGVEHAHSAFSAPTYGARVLGVYQGMRAPLDPAPRSPRIIARREPVPA